MKVKVLFLSLIGAMAIFMASCGGKQAEQAETSAISVDSLMSAAPALLGDTVDVSGYCSHLCKHGGRKAFLVGADTAIVLRCEATAAMGGAFAPDCIGKTLTVRGVVRENRIDEEQVAAMEARRAAADSTARAHEACDTEKKAQGQQDIDTFEARMADYRSKIAARAEAEGKAYLSFYYLEAIGYTVDTPEAE
ncbi:MAG: hypothetical protein NC418_01980 [Muribaculaceae bacterium]|nr:hypothetical protein [Muribaculaceae bacterium]